MRVAYSTRQAANLLKMRDVRIRNYARAAGLGDRGHTARAALRFDFRDLALLRSCRRLESEGVSHPRICRALVVLRQAAGGGCHLSAFSLQRRGRGIVARGPGGAWNLETGQRELALDTAPPGWVAPAVPAPARVRPPAAVPADPSADDWFDLGVALEETEPERAYHAYLQALACNPEHAEAMINAGRLSAAGGDPKRAAAYFRLAIRVDPSHPVAHFNLGVTLHDAGDAAGAIKSYRTALIHDPHFADAHYNLAALLEQQGDRQGALQHMRAYKVACELVPS